MTTHKEALKLAREGVEIHSPNSPEYIVCAALIEALAQPKRDLKPKCFADFQPNHEHERKCQWCAVETECKTGVAQPEQEHETLNYTVHVECKRCGSHERYDLEIAYPQRTWVGLTDEHIDEAIDAWFDCEGKTWRVRMRAAIKAAHGIKE